MLKLISWNIRQGGGTRAASIIKALISENPSVIVLSEYHNNSNGALIRSNLLKAGFLHQGVGHDLKEVNTVLIASKFPFDLEHCPSADVTYKSAIIKAKFEAFCVYGMYLPHKKKHKLFEFLMQDLSDTLPNILVGDYNTGINYVDQKGNSFMYSEYLPKLNEKGYVDAFREMHKEVKEYSWYSHQGNGYRYDHTYVSEILKPLIKECYYLHEWRENKLSDHSPMVLELGL